MKVFACSPTDIPSTLYRVHYTGSRTTFSPQNGFEAGDITRTFENDDVRGFKEVVELQFTWGCRQSLPFISLFSDLEHAENWACKMLSGGGAHGEAESEYGLHTIDTRDVARTHTFYKLSDLVKMLDLNIPEGARQHIKGAYLCLYHVPAAAIVCVRTLEEVERGK